MDDRPGEVKWWKIIRRGWCERVDDRRGWMTDVGSVYSKYRFSSRATCTGRRASLIHREETRTVSIYGVPGVNQR